MKIKPFLFLLMMLLILQSCSDALSNSKAEDILEDCLDKNPIQRTTSVNISKATFTTNKNDSILLSKYLELEDDGYLTMELLQEFTKGWRKGRKEYKISLTEDALEYMEEIPENANYASAKTYNYKVDEVLEVQETPATNTAKVKVQFKADDITPFAILSSKDPAEYWIKTVTMKKTSNGWKYCDNY